MDRVSGTGDPQSDVHPGKESTSASERLQVMLDALLEEVGNLPADEAGKTLAAMQIKIANVQKEVASTPESKSTQERYHDLIASYRQLVGPEALSASAFQQLSDEKKTKVWEVIFTLAKLLRDDRSLLSKKYLQDYAGLLDQFGLFTRLPEMIVGWETVAQNYRFPFEQSHNQILRTCIVAAEILNHPFNIEDPERPLEHMESGLLKLRRETGNAVSVSLDERLEGLQKELRDAKAALQTATDQIQVILAETTARVPQSSGYNQLNFPENPTRGNLEYLQRYIKDVTEVQLALVKYAELEARVRQERRGFRWIGKADKPVSLDELKKWVSDQPDRPISVYRSSGKLLLAFRPTTEDLGKIYGMATNEELKALANPCSEANLNNLIKAANTIAGLLTKIEGFSTQFQQLKQTVHLQGYRYSLDSATLGTDLAEITPDEMNQQFKQQFQDFLVQVEQIDGDQRFWGRLFTEDPDAVPAFWKLVFVGKTIDQKNIASTTLLRLIDQYSTSIPDKEKPIGNLVIPRVLGFLLGVKIAKHDRGYVPPNFDNDFVPDGIRGRQGVDFSRVHELAEELYDLWTKAREPKQ